MVIEEATCELLGNDGGKYSLVGEMVLDSDADSLYRMLVDYEASPRIFATVDSCAVDALPDGRLLVRQSCRWKFMVFGGAFPCQLAVLERPEERYMEVALHKKDSSASLRGRDRLRGTGRRRSRSAHPRAQTRAHAPLRAQDILATDSRDFAGRAKRGGAVGRAAVSRLGERGDGPSRHPCREVTTTGTRPTGAGMGVNRV